MLNVRQIQTEDGNGKSRDRAACKQKKRPVDLVHLSHHTLGNRNLEREILGLFHRQSALYLERMTAAKSADAWREAAHTIKGSARGIGAWEIVRFAEQAEKMTWSAGQVKTRLIGKLTRSIQDANIFILQVLGDN